MMNPLKLLHLDTHEQWRQWLSKHGESESEVWLVFYKKQSGKQRIFYDDAVREALCFGWIDSLVRRLDDERYAQKFTPRRMNSKWSALNKRRVGELMKEGRMTQAGLAKVTFEPNKADEEPPAARLKPALVLPEELLNEIKVHEPAWENFSKLPPSHRRQYVLWIMDGKKEETRSKRLREAIERLTRNERLGMK